MAQWQIFDEGKDGNGDKILIARVKTFDDGLLAEPGDADFTVDAVKAEVAKLKASGGFGYMGRSTLVSKAAEPEIQSAVDDIVASVKADPEAPEPDPTIIRKAVLQDWGLHEP